MLISELASFYFFKRFMPNSSSSLSGSAKLCRPWRSCICCLLCLLLRSDWPEQKAHSMWSQDTDWGWKPVQEEEGGRTGQRGGQAARQAPPGHRQLGGALWGPLPTCCHVGSKGQEGRPRRSLLPTKGCRLRSRAGQPGLPERVAPGCSGQSVCISVVTAESTPSVLTVR